MKLKQYAVAMITSAALVLLLMASCAGSNVTLDTVTTDSGANLPVVSGISKSEEINRRLAELFMPYAQLAQPAVDGSNGKLRVVYRLSLSEDSGVFHKIYDLDMALANDTDRMSIASVHINKADDLTAQAAEDLGWLSSSELADSAVYLHHAGLDPDYTAQDMNETVSEEYAVDTFVGLYEAFASKPLDISNVRVGSAVGTTYQKALKLGLLSSYGDYDYEYPEAYVTNVLNMADTVINAVEHDVYGRHSETVTDQEFAHMLQALCQICYVQEQSDAKYRWSELAEMDFAAIADEMHLDDTHMFTRQDGAELVGRITQAGPKYSRSFDGSRLDTVDDSENLWVRRAVTYSLMEYYGDSVIFAPDQAFTVTNAIKNAGTYVIGRFNDWYYATDYAWDGLYTKQDVLIAAGRTAAYFADRSEEDKYNFDTQFVLNDRDYSWFFSQRNTGASSSVNCMPAIAAMAAHWYDQNSTVTVQDMRKTNKSKDGWRVIELRGALDAYQIPYVADVVDEGDAGINKLVGLLDEGKIILVQYSDRPFSMTGHCYVIYGYRKVGDSVTFIINDADSLAYRTEIFGRPNGNGDEVEGRFAIWSITRFWREITVVG